MMTPERKSIAIIRPVEFYGNALPRPQSFFDNPQFNSHRVDPVLDPLLSSWDSDARWSMGSLNSTRLHLQGRIEGTVSDKKRSGCDSPPAATVALKRRRYVDLNDDDEEEEDEGVARIIKNLSDDFDRVAGESKIIESAGKRLKAKKKKKTSKVEGTSSTRITSPRLTKPLCFRI